MKRVRWIALGAAVLTGILMLVFLTTLNKLEQPPKKTVVTAVATIPANTPITSEMVALTNLPNEAVLANAITDTATVVGKVSKTDIFAGEQVLLSKLVVAGASDSSTLAYAIKPGMRAITIGVDTVSGLAHLVTPGNHVDLIAQYNAGDNKQSLAAALIAQDVPVLAVDMVLSLNGKVNNADATYVTLTLQVTPTQALKISLAESAGTVKAILRSPVDESLTSLPKMTLDTMLSQ